MSSFSRYNLLRRIGVGGMAEVWKAKAIGPQGFEKTVAIKKVLPEFSDSEDFIAMFVGEAKLVADLVHPNIVQVFDFGHVGRSDYFIVMEYVGGQDLSSVLQRAARKGTPIPQEAALYIVAECAKGLAFAHAKTDSAGRPLGIVHRDLSPGNMLISYGGEVKITDFGIAKFATATDRTQAGTVRGNAAYLSPEQAERRTLDGRSDIFTLGTVLFELLAGKRLFPGNNLPDLVDQARNFRFPAAEAARFPAEIQSVLMGMLRNEPDRRFQDAYELEEALLGALAGPGLLEGRRRLTTLMQTLFADERQAEMDVDPQDAPASSISLERPGQTPPEPRPQRRTGPAPSPAIDEPTAAIGNPYGGGNASGDSHDDLDAEERHAGSLEASGADGRYTGAIDAPVGAGRRAGSLGALAGDRSRARALDPPAPGRRHTRSLEAPVAGGRSAGSADAPPVDSNPSKPGRVPVLVMGLTLACVAFVAGFAAIAGSGWSPGNGSTEASATPPSSPLEPRTTFAAADPATTAEPAVPGSPVATPDLATAVRPSPTAVPARKGRLTVYARPWCQVWVDGRKVSDETPLENFRLPAGRRVLRFENPILDFRLEKTIDLPPGGQVHLFVDVPANSAKITRAR